MKKTVRAARLNSSFFSRLQITFPIALHIRDSTLHFLQCPSRRPPGQGKRLRRHSLSPSCRPRQKNQKGTHRRRASILFIVRPSPTYSSFIPYCGRKVKLFLQKTQGLRKQPQDIREKSVAISTATPFSGKGNADRMILGNIERDMPMV